MVKEAVYDFLKLQNRPYSINDIIQNVGKEFGKSAVAKAADQLVQSKKLICKIYAKQKIYCIKQDDDSRCDDKMEEQLKAMDREINELSSKVKSAEGKLTSSNAQLQELQSKMSIKEAEEKREQLQNEISEFKEKLEAVAETAPVSEDEKREINDQYNKCVKEYKKRKRICMEMIDSILDGYPKTKKHLFEDIGMETDEDVGFKFEEIVNM